MTHINRRAALTVIASGPAALAGIPALASVEEDAELIRLWGDLKAADAEYKNRQSAFTSAEEAAAAGAGRHWRYVDVQHDPMRAVFVCARDGLLKVIPLSHKDGISIMEQARKIEARLTAEFRRSWDASKRRCKVSASERAMSRSLDRRQDIIEQIAETPAKSMTGVCIKLAVIQLERDWVQEPAIMLADTAYETVAGLVGTDYAAQISA